MLRITVYHPHFTSPYNYFCITTTTSMAESRTSTGREASHKVRTAITVVLHDAEFSLGTQRMRATRDAARKVLDAISGSDDCSRASFVEFATKLDQRLSKLATPSSNKLMSTQIMKLWSLFHACRISDLRKMWTDLFTYLKLDSTQDPLLMVGVC